MAAKTRAAITHRWYTRHKTRIRQAQREIRRERKLKLIALKGGKCTDCGFAGHAAAMDFDHLNASTKISNVGFMLTRSWDRVLAEVAKCELVCANCHRVRTFVRRGAA